MWPSLCPHRSVWDLVPTLAFVLSLVMLLFFCIADKENQSQPNIYDNCNSYDITSSICTSTVLAVILGFSSIGAFTHE